MKKLKMYGVAYEEGGIWFPQVHKYFGVVLNIQQHTEYTRGISAVTYSYDGDEVDESRFLEPPYYG